MTCIPFKDGNITGIVCVGDRYFEVFDGKRTWRWEEGRYGGPLLVDRNGEPLRRQPGARSKFWDIWEAHKKERAP